MNLPLSIQYAFAVEIGAYAAYKGHAAILTGENRAVILRIRRNELLHAAQLRRVMRSMSIKPNPILNAMLWVLGTSISLGCHIFGSYIANKGAAVIEYINWRSYLEMSIKARTLNRNDLADMFLVMAITETKHEIILNRLKKET
jgi:rubrerythrin